MLYLQLFTQNYFQNNHINNNTLKERQVEGKDILGLLLSGVSVASKGYQHLFNVNP